MSNPLKGAEQHLEFQLQQGGAGSKCLNLAASLIQNRGKNLKILLHDYGYRE
jgi:hypothetical protein